ncbi:MAG: hypothetical protein K2P75_09010 [Sphingobacteriaceae bacterium]|nr:hypothetical protein [Sphingobacteriaceae bacterium]
MRVFSTWNKGLFDSNYQIFTEGKISGSLLFDNWKNEAKGMGLTTNISFKTEGFLTPKTNILNDKNEIIGVITYESWQTKATINMASGEIFGWSFSNSWLSNWSITDFKEKSISYQSKSGTGTIESTASDEIMLLTGIFIRECYARILVVILFLLIIPAFSRSIF